MAYSVEVESLTDDESVPDSALSSVSSNSESDHSEKSHHGWRRRSGLASLRVREGRYRIASARKRRAKEIQTVGSSSAEEGICTTFSRDDHEMTSFISLCDLCGIFSSRDTSKDQVIVAVEATAITDAELLRRQSDDCDNYISGNNVVGVVHHSGPSGKAHGIIPGMRVASVANWRTQSRYVSVPADQVISVSKRLDPADIACLISTFLPAFQALHHGRPLANRYTRSCLKGKRVMIVGAKPIEVHAMTWLTRWSGASEVFIVSSRSSDRPMTSTKQLYFLDIKSQAKWLPIVKGRMDVVLDYDVPQNMSRSALAPRGQLVYCPRLSDSSDSFCGLGLGALFDQYQVSTIERATLFDFADCTKNFPDGLRQDIDYLLSLLAARRLRPRIDRFIGLHEASQISHHNTKELVGAIICEPWKKKSMNEY